MSDNDDIEVDSDEDSSRFHSGADKRAHHNALERKRRDHIKDSFHSLRDSVPALQGEKASRAQILDKATEYIQFMRRKNHTHQQDIDDLKRQNTLLEQQVRALEKVKGTTQLQGGYSSSDSSLYTNPKGSAVSAFDGGSDSSSESEPEEPPTRKKIRHAAPPGSTRLLHPPLPLQSETPQLPLSPSLQASQTPAQTPHPGSSERTTRSTVSALAPPVSALAPP